MVLTWCELDAGAGGGGGGSAAAVRRAWALVLLCFMLTVAHAYDKRAEMAPAPFVLGSRYGRSPPRIMAPRNDRFFIGSRYGKRAELGPPDVDLGLEQPPPRPPLPPMTSPAAGAHALLCDYTGVYSLYHCRPDIPTNRRAEESGPDEE